MPTEDSGREEGMVPVIEGRASRQPLCLCGDWKYVSSGQKYTWNG